MVLLDRHWTVQGTRQQMFPSILDLDSSTRLVTTRNLRCLLQLSIGRRHLQLITTDDSQGSLRSLKTLTNQFPNELDGIGAINRATTHIFLARASVLVAKPE